MCEPPPFAIRGCDVSDKIKFGRGGRKPAVPGADPVAPDTGQRPIPRSPAQALRPDGGVEPPKRRRARAARSQVVVFANFLFTLLIMSMVALGGALYLGKLRFEQPGPLAASSTYMVRPGATLIQIASLLSVSTSANASNINTKNSTSASRPLTSPVTSGRPRVRSTWPSSQRSA